MVTIYNSFVYVYYDIACMNIGTSNKIPPDKNNYTLYIKPFDFKVLPFPYIDHFFKVAV